ncbi:MAG: response regulator [Desulfobacterales bacterium]|nr:response regulator [Desulfobacterales bacterium]
MSKPIRILYVDDNPHDRALVRALLEKEHGGFQIAEAASREDFEARLEEGEYDLILSDFNILGFEGLQVVDIIRAKNPHLPVVILTGTGSEEIAIEALRRGVDDYIVKTPNHMKRLPHMIYSVLEKKRLGEERTQVQQERDRLFNFSIDLLCIAGFDGYFKQLNPAWEKTFGWTNDELVSKPYIELVHPDDLKRTTHTGHNLANGIQVFSFENRYLCKDGTYKWISWNSYPLVEEGLIFAVARDVTQHKLMEEERIQSTQKLIKAMESTIEAIATTVEMRDPYTAGHQRRVAGIVSAIAREMCLSEDQVHGISMAGIVHDIGKISVPAEILSRPGKLSKIEFDLIKMHPQAGYDILKDIEFPLPIAQTILQHHERMDGSGYPAGLSKDAILLEARIMSVADVVEAMASHRPYRPAIGLDGALEEISMNSGILYDADVVDACIRLFREKGFKLE